jgi:SAM-dependent methyltransferase
MKAPATDPVEREHYRRLERAWQDDVGHALLDKPFELAGGAAVFARQLDRIAAALAGVADGPLVDIGCGNGQLLLRLRDDPRFTNRPLIGVDVSVAVATAAARGLRAVKADGEFLPFRDASVAAVVYNGALHHIIDYRAALREALRVLRPGGRLVVFEPVSSAFSRVVHHVLDPLVFRAACEYESPIDQRYKDDFRERAIVQVLATNRVALVHEHSDFLAYPLTGCYATSPFARSARLMRLLIAAEERVARIPGLRRLARALAWRFLIVGVKDGTPA